MEINKLLHECPVNEIVEELSKRKSITKIKINEGNGAIVSFVSGSIAVSGESMIFIVKQ